MGNTLKKTRNKVAISPVPARCEPRNTKGTNLKLSPEAVESLARIKQQHGISNTFAVIRGVLMLETYLNAPQGRGL